MHSNPSDERIGYSPDEAARLIGSGVRRIWTAIADGRLPCRKFGRRNIILRHDLEAFARSLPVKEVDHAS